MISRFCTAFMLLAALLLAGCGGGSSGGSAVPAQSGAGSAITPNANLAAGALKTTVTVKVPLTNQASSKGRRPLYLTSYTQGIDLQAIQSGASSGYIFYALTPQSTYCQTQGSTLVCTLALMAPPGNIQIVANTYDNTTKATSNLLSTVSSSVTVAASTANTFTIATNPIAASMNATTSPAAVGACPVVGTSQTVTYNYTTADADGGSLSGTLGNTLQGVVTDTTGSFSSSFLTTPLTAAGGSFMVSYNGGTPTNGVALFSTTASLNQLGTANATILGAPTGGVTPLSSGTAGSAHYLYYADAANNVIDSFDVCGRPSNGVTSQFALGSATNPTDIAFDRAHPTTPRAVVLGSNKLVVVDLSGNTVLQTIDLTAAGFGSARRLNLSQNGALFVTVDNASNPTSAGQLLKFAVNASGPNYLSKPGNAASTAPLTVTVGVAPRGVNGGGTGNDVLVANSGDGTVMAINPRSGSTAPSVDATITIGGTPHGVTGPNSDASCQMVTNDNNTVTALHTLASGGTTLTQIGSPIALPGSPVNASAFFPNGFSGGSNVFSNTGMVETSAGAAVITNCASSGASFTQTATWTGFMSNPVGNVPSNYTPTGAVGYMLYVVGMNNGTPVLQAFNFGTNVPLFSIPLAAGVSPTSVSAGP